MHELSVHGGGDPPIAVCGAPCSGAASLADVAGSWLAQDTSTTSPKNYKQRCRGHNLKILYLQHKTSFKIRMKAVIFRTTGPPSVLETVTDWPVPTPRVGEVLIKVRATSVNPIDAHVRKGKGFPRLLYKFPEVGSRR